MNIAWDLLPPAASTDTRFSRLYRAPPLIAGEAISSWIYRIAAVYGWSPKEIGGLLGNDSDLASWDFVRSPGHTKQISLVTINKCGELEFGESPLGQEPFRFLTTYPTYPRVAPLYQYCPQCLGDDEVPYFRLQWRLAFTLICDRHLVKLAAHCHACGSRINLETEKRIQLPKKIRNQTLCLCPKCSAYLPDNKSGRVPCDLALALIRFQRSAAQTLCFRSQANQSYDATSVITFWKESLRAKRVIQRVKRKGVYGGVPYWALEIDWKAVVGTDYFKRCREWCRDRQSTRRRNSIQHIRRIIINYRV